MKLLTVGQMARVAGVSRTSLLYYASARPGMAGGGRVTPLPLSAIFAPSAPPAGGEAQEAKTLLDLRNLVAQ